MMRKVEARAEFSRPGDVVAVNGALLGTRSFFSTSQ